MNKIIEEDMNEILKSNVTWKCFQGKTILISGATGMIPSYMVIALLYLNKRNPDFKCNIIAIIRNMEKAKQLFRDFISEPFFQLIQSDICEPILVKEKIDYVIHAASPASPQIFVKYPVDTIMPNVLGTQNLLKLAAKNEVERFLLFSSGDVYGQVQGSTVIHENSLGIVDQLNMRNSYAESKRLAETLCRAYYEQYNIPVVIARISHTYGPTVNLDGNDQRVFSEFVKNIINNQNIVMKSKGTATRPFCYLTDATVALYKIMLEGKLGDAYNMSNDECNVSIKDLADMLVGLFPEKNLKVICELRSAKDDYKESFVSNPIVDNSKLRKLGWRPQIGIQEGFRRTILALSPTEE